MVVRRGRRGLARHIPLAQARGPRHLGRLHVRTGRHRYAARRRGVGLLAVAVVVGRRPARAAVHLHVLTQGRGVGVGLVAARHAAVVGLVRRVDVGVLLPVRGVGEPPVAPFVFALERLLTWNNDKKHINSLYFIKGIKIVYRLKS